MRYRTIISIATAAFFGIVCVSIDASARGRGGFAGGRAGGFHAGGMRAGGVHAGAYRGGGVRAAGVHRGYHGAYRGGAYVRRGVGVGLGAAAVGAAAAAPYYYGRPQCGYSPYPPC
jgi:hypothetical protein